MQNYSLSNEIKYDTNNKIDKYNLYRQFVAWSCDGCSVAPLTDYANDEILRGFPKQDDFSTTFDERLYLDLRRAKGYTGELKTKIKGITLNMMLKNVTKKVKLKVWGYSQGEYLYVLSAQGLTMRYKTYTVTKENDTAS